MIERGPSSQNTAKYRVAHLNRKGADLVLIPVDDSIGRRPIAEQAEVLRTLQKCATSAGLKGHVVLVWDKGGGATGLLADRQVHAHVQGTTLSMVLSNVNRELTVKGFNIGVPYGAGGGGGGDDKTRQGTLSVASDVADAEVIVDGGFVGNVPAKIKLSEGKHIVEVKKPGYNDFKREVRITEGAELNIKATLERGDTIVFSRSDSADFQKDVMDSRGKVTAFQKRHRVGLVTLLFTDIVGSTKLKQELGDRDAVRLIQLHHSTVRGILNTYPMAEEISTAGDSFFMVFAKPSDAVRFSLQLQARLRILSKEENRLVLDRIGIHVGEVFIEEEEGSGRLNDLYGIQVDSSARVMSLGEGDQILMTRFAFDNARQVLKGQDIEGVGQLSWINHGLYSLKGVEEPLEICEVGEVGHAVLKPPPDSDKVHRVDASGRALSPADSKQSDAASRHVVVSTKPTHSTGTLRPPPFSRR